MSIINKEKKLILILQYFKKSKQLIKSYQFYYVKNFVVAGLLNFSLHQQLIVD